MIGLTSSELPPGCSHSHGSDSIWCAAEPLNPILIPAKPNGQPREPTASIILKPLDQLQGGGEGARRTPLCLQHPWSSLCCVKHKKSRSVEATGEREGDLVEAAGIGLHWCVESIFAEDGCLVNVNSLCNTCIAKGGSSRRGGGEGEGGGAAAGGNAASSNEIFPSLANPGLLQITSQVMHVVC